MSDVPEGHYKLLARAIAEGEVVPFLGAGVNLCEREPGAIWRLGESLPDASELTEHLASAFAYPVTEKQDIMRVSQYGAVMSGSGALYKMLHSVLDADYSPTVVHRFIADIPRLLEEQGKPPRHLLIVTTNYDDVMERALEGQEFDIVSYVANGEYHGKFTHTDYVGNTTVIHDPATYDGLPIEVPSFVLSRTILLKIHGTVIRSQTSAVSDSYVITEDDYIEYLSRTDVAKIMPPALISKLKQSHFLFLGYSLGDWNMRAILHSLWRDRTLDWTSWAVQIDSQPIELRFWLKRNVDIFNIPVSQYVTNLRAELAAL